MKSAAKTLSMAALACLVSTAILFAQSSKKPSAVESQYLISAKAGGINYVSGSVKIAGKNAKPFSAEQGDAANVGERILTGSDGRAEILLNPGSFVRLGENSEFEFIDTALDDLSVKLKTGSAVFEVFASDDFKVTVATPASKFVLVKSGIYRVDALPDGAGRIQVWKGRAELENAAAIKSGRMAMVAGGRTNVEKFDRDDKSELDAWSKTRAKELAKINAKLQNRQMNAALISSYSQRGWNVYDSFGLWVRDPVTRSFCFLPFGYGWSSPYGYWLQRDIWNYRLPQAIFYNPRLQNNNPNVNSPAQNVRPPFQTVQPPAFGGGQPQSSPGVAMPQAPTEARPSMPARSTQPAGSVRGRGTVAPLDQ